ncbi:MAG TPA: WbqC family protein [Paludibacteraceae bacterium]|nr:WbqC family protein [Paludibacteraceae bacterium]
MSGVVLTSTYLGNIQFYSKLVHFSEIWIEQHCHYTKQTYRNRCKIATANGVMALSIPTIKPATEKCKTKDIRIDNSQHWQQIHWRALEAGYNSSPFFEYYKDDFAPFYTNKFEFLVDYTFQLQSLVIALLELDCKVQLTEAYTTYDDALDYRDALSAKKEIEDNDFVISSYYQVFENKFGFIPNLSILDLLFNMGNESILVLQKSASKH